MGIDFVNFLYSSSNLRKKIVFTRWKFFRNSKNSLKFLIRFSFIFSFISFKIFKNLFFDFSNSICNSLVSFIFALYNFSLFFPSNINFLYSLSKGSFSLTLSISILFSLFFFI